MGEKLVKSIPVTGLENKKIAVEGQAEEFLSAMKELPHPNREEGEKTYETLVQKLRSNPDLALRFEKLAEYYGFRKSK